MSTTIDRSAPAAPTTDPARAVRLAVRAARHAPSVHNTQPWAFEVGERTLEVHADWTRQVSSRDPRGRQLLMSVGCAVLNARVALAAAGSGVAVERGCDVDRPSVVAGLRTDDAFTPDAALGALAPFVTLRHTNRRPFATAGVEAGTVARLVAAAALEGVDVHEVAVGAERLALARIASDLDRSELRRWRDLSESDAPDSGDDLGLPPTVLVLGTRADTPVAWERTGEALQRMWLELTAAGYVAAPVTHVIEEPTVRARLRGDLGLAAHPHIVVRVGVAAPSPATRRRLLSDLLVPAR